MHIMCCEYIVIGMVYTCVELTHRLLLVCNVKNFAEKKSHGLFPP